MSDDNVYNMNFEVKPLTEFDRLKADMKELEAKIKEVTDLRTEATKRVNAHQAVADEENRQYQDLLSQLRESHANRLREIDEARREDVRLLSELNRALRDLQDKLAGFDKRYASIIEAQAMAERMKAAESAIKNLASDSLWWMKSAEFQKEDITFVVNAYMNGKSGVLNANEMGTGKTLETAAANQILTALFEKEHGIKPTRLWLTKKSLVKSNIHEIREWVPSEKPIYCHGDKDVREMAVEIALSSGQMLVANYEAVTSTKLIQNTTWDFVYIDEVHKLKGGANPNGPTAIWKYIKDVCAKARFVIMLSGSPMLNHPREMWSYLHIFNAEKFPTVKRFEREFLWAYGEVLHDKDGNIIPTIDFTKLITVLKDQMFRRTKKEISGQLKALDIDKLTEYRFVEMNGDQRRVYNEIRDRFFTWLDAEHEHALTANVIIAQLTRLRQIAQYPAGVKIEVKTEAGIVQETLRIDVEDSAKLDEAVDLIEELTSAGEQVLFFGSQFNEPLLELRRRLAKLDISCQLITGENSHMTREIEADFQQKKFQVLGINMRTGSEGMNLQKNPERWPGGASNVIFLDRWWNNETNRQAEDRLVRFGQTDVVTVHIIHAEDSVDNFIKALCEEKDAMIGGIMESEKLRSASDWKSYLKGMI